MFYQPMRSAIVDPLHGGVLAGMWHLITLHFILSAIALLLLGSQGAGGAVVWLVATQFASYAAAYLVISLRLGGATKLFQWIPFRSTAALAALGAATTP